MTRDSVSIKKDSAIALINLESILNIFCLLPLKCSYGVKIEILKNNKFLAFADVSILDIYL